MKAIPPDAEYSQPSHGNALPDKPDLADMVPNGVTKKNQSQAKADVFLIHPTTHPYSSKAISVWNGNVNDTVLPY